MKIGFEVLTPVVIYLLGYNAVLTFNGLHGVISHKTVLSIKVGL
jgi:hypothetical protein